MFREQVLEKSGGLRSLEIAWSNVVETAIASGIDEPTIAAAIDGFDSPASLAKLCESMSGMEVDAESILSRITTQSEESGFGINSWFQALERLLLYLKKTNRSSHIDHMLGYLSCSAEFLNQSNSKIQFPEGVESFLEEFGYEGEA